MTRKALRSSFVLVLIPCLLLMGMAPAHAACPCCVPSTGPSCHIGKAKGHFQTHRCCNGAKNVLFDINQACGFEISHYLAFVVARIEYPQPATFAALSPELLLLHQPLSGLTERDSYLAEAVSGPLYLRNLSLRY